MGPEPPRGARLSAGAQEERKADEYFETDCKDRGKVLRDLMKSGETDVSPKQMEDALDEFDDGFAQMALDALKEERT